MKLLNFFRRLKIKEPITAKFVKFSAEGTPYVDSAISAISPKVLDELIEIEMAKRNEIKVTSQGVLYRDVNRTPKEKVLAVARRLKGRDE